MFRAQLGHCFQIEIEWHMNGVSHGRILTKGGTHKLPEGGRWTPELVAIFEFPDMNSLNAWYNSPEYQPLIALRKQWSSDLDMFITLEGA